MGTVVELFKARPQAKPAAAPRAPAPAEQREQGPTILANAGMLVAAGMDGLNQMEQEGTAMQVLSALLFYAHQGQDGGKRARRAVIAMQELLGGSPEAA